MVKAADCAYAPYKANDQLVFDAFESCLLVWEKYGAWCFFIDVTTTIWHFMAFCVNVFLLIHYRLNTINVLVCMVKWSWNGMLILRVMLWSMCCRFCVRANITHSAFHFWKLFSRSHILRWRAYSFLLNKKKGLICGVFLWLLMTRIKWIWRKYANEIF